eukprot:scaffold385_cov305-Pinguiococcus_pyrenoidosus.AAC.49
MLRYKAAKGPEKVHPFCNAVGRKRSSLSVVPRRSGVLQHLVCQRQARSESPEPPLVLLPS